MMMVTLANEDKIVDKGFDSEAQDPNVVAPPETVKTALPRRHQFSEIGTSTQITPAQQSTIESLPEEKSITLTEKSPTGLKHNRSLQMGQLLEYVPSSQRNGKFVVKIEEDDIKKNEDHWSTSLIEFQEYSFIGVLLYKHDNIRKPQMHPPMTLVANLLHLLRTKFKITQEEHVRSLKIPLVKPVGENSSVERYAACRRGIRQGGHKNHYLVTRDFQNSQQHLGYRLMLIKVPCLYDLEVMRKKPSENKSK
ncbi:hypothetical protein K7X08_032676 [Anisodus acutangulus]|uniref:Uncharacterized protein n=1 Tax=Anisodus acutangulus TaxID=402998 RepID=A0A9Q1MVV8_9SOLA|nr:hypothetical protein K7X08_032676 [Anisodus acutangulus]